MNMQNLNKGWHAHSVDATLKMLDTDPEGINASEVLKRRTQYGSNVLEMRTGRSALMRFLMQFHHVLIYFLIFSAAITLFLDHLLDTLVIIAVVLANALIGFIQEGKAEKAMESIREMLTPHANVIRDGQRTNVMSYEVVPGDIILLEAGDKVPADIRLMSARNVSVEEAILTGESVPTQKGIEPVAANAPIGDRTCMLFSGTLLNTGVAKGVVVATGASTEIGKVATLLSAVETITTPMVEQMGVFAKWLTFLILVVASLLLLYGYFVSKMAFADLFMVVVGLSVAAIPEGLPAITTITLAIGVRAMALRNVIVRRLPSIETLGSVSVICTDKTGTLTRNEMMVATVITYEHSLQVSGDGYKPEGDIYIQNKLLSIQERAAVKEIALAASLCNDAAIHHHNGVWKSEGDPMEGALLAFASKVQLLNFNHVRNMWHRIDEIPFDSRHRFMATLNHNSEGMACIFVKGAPEQILSMCSNQNTGDGANELLDIDYWTNEARRISAQGQRILAFASRTISSDHLDLEIKDVKADFSFLGMVGLIDPPRPESITAIKQCQSAGIRVKMITGDHAGTAAAIARQIGIQNTTAVLTGGDIDEMDDSKLKQVVVETDIFARTSPEHKLRLVMALQSHGFAVAMTGDGVNDAPALKRADTGIAMGHKGSEAAKEAADLVLLDDNFVSIVAAIREGRTVYDNIKKVISWTLPTNAGEAAVIIFALLAGSSMPVTPVQILWINLITATTLGLVLAFEPTEEKTMQRPPRPRSESLIGGDLVWHIVLVSILFLAGVIGIYSYAIGEGYSVPLAQTFAVNTLVVMEIAHLFFIRNIYSTSFNWAAYKGTKVAWIAISVVLLAQFAITYISFFQSIFGTESIPIKGIILISGIGVTLFFILEIEKQIRMQLKANL
jgi:magnesium-transporting ATPase (P-type)